MDTQKIRTQWFLCFLSPERAALVHLLTKLVFFDFQTGVPLMFLLYTLLFPTMSFFLKMSVYLSAALLSTALALLGHTLLLESATLPAHPRPHHLRTPTTLRSKSVSERLVLSGSFRWSERLPCFVRTKWMYRARDAVAGQSHRTMTRTTGETATVAPQVALTEVTATLMIGETGSSLTTEVGSEAETTAMVTDGRGASTAA